MLTNQWYPIFESRRLKPGRVTAVTRLARKLVLWRDRGGRAVCLPDRCPHRAAPLSGGSVREGCLQCPYHGFRFDVGGRCTLIPANGADTPVPRGFDIEPCTIEEQHGLIWLWHGAPGRVSRELPWFDGAPEAVGGSAAFEREFPFSYLRVMENLSDFHHAPFVHRWTLPGIGSRVDDFQAQTSGTEISVRCTMRYEGDARDAKKGFRFATRIKLPSLAMLEVFAGVRFVLSATPIDSNRTWLYVRYAQDYVPWWLGGRLFARLAAAWDFDMVFSYQDAPMLRSQQLADPSDISGYHLIKADRGAALFFALCKKAMLENERSDSARVSIAEAS